MDCGVYVSFREGLIYRKGIRLDIALHGDERKSVGPFVLANDVSGRRCHGEEYFLPTMSWTL
jgi:hypothetical protein